MKPLLLLLLLLVAVSKPADSLLKHHHGREQSLNYLEPASKIDVSGLEREEIHHGQEDAKEAEAASIQNEPDTAAHKFSMGAERLEAARNDAEAEKTSSARNRESREHRLAQRLEALAQDNRQDSASEDDNVSDPVPGEREKTEAESISERNEEDDVAGQESSSLNDSETSKNERKKKKGHKLRSNSLLGTEPSSPTEGESPTKSEESENAGWGADISKTEEVAPAEGESESPSNSTAPASAS